MLELRGVPEWCSAVLMNLKKLRHPGNGCYFTVNRKQLDSGELGQRTHPVEDWLGEMVLRDLLQRKPRAHQL